MSHLVSDCPRCGTARVTFDVGDLVYVGERYGWARVAEAFSVCRHCLRPTIFILEQKGPQTSSLCSHKSTLLEYKASLNQLFSIESYVSLKHETALSAPDHVPEQTKIVFDEAAVCLALQCWNAAGAMLRACIDLATKGMLPEEEVQGLNEHRRRNLAPRLTWLFENGKLPSDLQDLSDCIREDGNDAVHDASLSKEDAEDLLDFTLELLRRLYTEPGRLDKAKARRQARRGFESEQEA